MVADEDKGVEIAMTDGTTSGTGPAGPAGPAGLDRTSPLPLWSQLHRDLLRRLDSGEFDATFPGELALVGQYAVSRHTVRQALRELRQDGVVSAARGRASRVATPEIAQPFGSLYSLFAAVEEAGQRQHSVVRRLEARADGIIAARLGLEESTPLVYVERVRLADEVPLAMDRVWLPARLAAPLLEADLTNTSLYGELQKRCGVTLTGGREEVRAVIPTAAESALLDVPSDVAALMVERIGYLNAQPVEWRTTLVRGDRFALTTDFSSRDRAGRALSGVTTPLSLR